MEMEEIRDIARIHGIQSTKKFIHKVDLVRTIQLAEGRECCFKLFGHCDNMRCFWRGDCQRIV